MDESTALAMAEQFLRENYSEGDPEMAIDYQNVRCDESHLIAPYNSVEYLESRDEMKRLLGLWPIKVSLATGEARFSGLEEYL
ncbi:MULTISPECIES: hypothetical protein [unclassified Streptomyces]|uniref:hypothetical protein n=1 Tax=unclassified Streptomyces TaxID=2593676 RepID=UPI0016610B4D|nr:MULTISPECIES: hypothetical protein [unclassified Streptomyces]MBD0707848.1 hypothetical protein [Streptomyces sp. CBMA291]MBD0717549.1 hypothetical protein [Streptomyces sp. CBMA370]